MCRSSAGEIIPFLISLLVFYSNFIESKTENITAAPFTVLVLCENSKLFCSGVILSDSWVLTAAHCFFDTDGRYSENDTSVRVVAGTDGLTLVQSDIESGKAQMRSSANVIVHNLYDQETNFINNLALVSLTQPFNWTERVAAVNLIPSYVNSSFSTQEDADDDEDGTTGELQVNIDYSGFACLAYGFGKISRFKQMKMDFFLKRQKYFIDKSCGCLERIGNVLSEFDILQRRNIFLCDTDARARKRGLCAGDGGGPLICHGALRGVASTIFHYENRAECTLSTDVKQECGSPETLSVFTDVCYFNYWLIGYIPDFPRMTHKCTKKL